MQRKKELKNFMNITATDDVMKLMIKTKRQRRVKKGKTFNVFMRPFKEGKVEASLEKLMFELKNACDNPFLNESCHFQILFFEVGFLNMIGHWFMTDVAIAKGKVNTLTIESTNMGMCRIARSTFEKNFPDGEHFLYYDENSLNQLYENNEKNKNIQVSGAGCDAFSKQFASFFSKQDINKLYSALHIAAQNKNEMNAYRPYEFNTGDCVHQKELKILAPIFRGWQHIPSAQKELSTLESEIVSNKKDAKGTEGTTLLAYRELHQENNRNTSVLKKWDQDVERIKALSSKNRERLLSGFDETGSGFLAYPMLESVIRPLLNEHCDVKILAENIEWVCTQLAEKILPVNYVFFQKRPYEVDEIINQLKLLPGELKDENNKALVIDEFILLIQKLIANFLKENINLFPILDNIFGDDRFVKLLPKRKLDDTS